MACFAEAPNPIPRIVHYPTVMQSDVLLRRHCHQVFKPVVIWDTVNVVNEYPVRYWAVCGFPNQPMNIEVVAAFIATMNNFITHVYTSQTKSPSVADQVTRQGGLALRPEGPSVFDQLCCRLPQKCEKTTFGGYR